MASTSATAEAVLLAADASTVFAGDALVTHDAAAPTWRRREPQLWSDAVQADPVEAHAALQRRVRGDRPPASAGQARRSVVEPGPATEVGPHRGA